VGETKQYKHHKGLEKENLRDNMTNLEIALNILAEATDYLLPANDSDEE
jgi:hypothetical protein